MDNSDDKSYIKILEEAQKKIPNVVLPSMGIINNEVKVNIDGKDYVKNSDNVKEVR